MNVLLNCGSPVKRNLQEIWPHLPNLEWLHSSAAGVEHILFDDLIHGPVTLTNAKVRAPLACRPPGSQERCQVMVSHALWLVCAGKLSTLLFWTR